MSPQVIQGEYSSKADTWSAGVVAFTLLSSTRPFDGETNQQIARKIINEEYDKDFQGEEWKQVSSDAKKFVASLLTYDQDQRKSAPQALLSGWLNREFPLDKRRPDEQVMNRVQNALIHSAKDSKFKKLAMNIIAYNSSKEDIEKLRGAFDQYDSNNNGTILYFEFRKALNGCNFSDSELKRIFASIDVNRTGVINYTEFLSATLETRGRIEDERIAEAFDKLDTDNRGFISKENICTVLGSKCTAKECDDIINELMEEVDADKDGQISYEEFLSMFREKHRASVDEACCRVAEAGTGGCSQKCR
jgi:calcium-dependent protein kinase